MPTLRFSADMSAYMSDVKWVVIEIWPKIHGEGVFNLSTQVSQMKAPFLSSFGRGQDDDVLVFNILPSVDGIENFIKT